MGRLGNTWVAWDKAIVRMIIHYGNDTEDLFIYIDDVYFN